jgi:hypothetical protein
MPQRAIGGFTEPVDAGVAYVRANVLEAIGPLRVAPRIAWAARRPKAMIERGDMWNGWVLRAVDLERYSLENLADWEE